jgi:hypothetical protein
MTKPFEAHIEELQEVIDGPHGKFWCHTPAVSALIAALEQSQRENINFKQGCENDPLLHEVIDLKERIAELEASQLTLTMPRHKTPDDFVDDVYSSEDLSMIYNACLLECKVKIRNAGGKVKGDE